MKHFYDILGLNSNSSPAEINGAYQKLSKKFDPHLNPGDQYFSTRFNEVNEAYQVLIDPGKRNRYDKELANSAVSPHSNLQATPYTFHKTRFRGPGVGMSIILLILALIIGAYLVQSFTSPKKHVVNETQAANSAVIKSPAHHKKKHHIKSTVVTVTPKVKSDTVLKKSAKTQVAVPRQATPAKITPVIIQPVAADLKKPVVADNTPLAKDEQPDKSVIDGPYIYATTVQPNITGIVNMRGGDLYNSPVIRQVPVNSKVYVLQKGRYYYKVSFEDKVGYVPKWSLEVK